MASLLNSLLARFGVLYVHTYMHISRFSLFFCCYFSFTWAHEPIPLLFFCPLKTSVFPPSSSFFLFLSTKLSCVCVRVCLSLSVLFPPLRLFLPLWILSY